MLLERAELTIREGHEAAFAEVMEKTGLDMLRAQPGVGAVRFGRGVENTRKFMLLVEWRAMGDHTAFTHSAGFGPFRALISEHSDGGAMEHFEMD